MRPVSVVDQPRTGTRTPAAAAGSISLLIVGEQRMLLKALEPLLITSGIHIVGNVAKAEDAQPLRGRPDVIVFDSGPERGEGALLSIRLLTEAYPESKLIVLETSSAPAEIARAIEAGASGYVLRTIAVEDLVAAIDRIAAGELLLPPHALGPVLEIMRTTSQQRRDSATLFANLTVREREVLAEIAGGRSTADVARRLFISPLTVRGHVRNLLGKLNVHSRLEAVALALQEGLIGPSSGPSQHTSPQRP